MNDAGSANLNFINLIQEFRAVGEFARFAQFNSPEAQAWIPDPNSKRSFLVSKLDWASLKQESHKEWLKFYRELLAIRRREIVPRIETIGPGQAVFRILGDRTVFVRWPFVKSGGLNLLANFSSSEIGITEGLQGRVLYGTPANAFDQKKMAPLSALWLLDE